MASYVDKIIKENRPDSLKIARPRVLEILKKLGYTLVPCKTLSALAQISNSKEIDGAWINLWRLDDIEDYGYEAYRLEDGTYTIYPADEKSPRGEYIQIVSVWTTLLAEGYRLYYPYVKNDEFFLYPTTTEPMPIWHHGNGYRCFTNDELAIWWSGHMVHNILMYEPYILGGRTNSDQGLPSSVLDALLWEVEAKTFTIYSDVTIVDMPEPKWISANDHQINSERLPADIAKQQALAFVKDMAEKGLLPPNPIVISSGDLESLIGWVPNDGNPNTVELINRLRQLLPHS